MPDREESMLKLAQLVAVYIDIGVKISKGVRSPFDAIDALKRGGGYLNRNGNCYWLNVGALRSARHRNLLLNEFEFVSPTAIEVLRSVPFDVDLPQTEYLICEHVVPCDYMETLLRTQHASAPLKPKCVLDFHSRFYRRCIITKSENRALRPVHRMPTDWRVGDRLFARYDNAGFGWARQWD